MTTDKKQSSSRTRDHRSTRRLAMQVLYQIDLLSGDDKPDANTDPVDLAESLDEEHDSLEQRVAAARAALAAWLRHEEYDALLTELAPDWPTHRQPPVDRAILRMACHEIAAGITSPKIAINEAVELAKEYGAEHSPSFINGVLDKASKRLVASPDLAPPKPSTGDPWLDDAMSD